MPKHKPRPGAVAAPQPMPQHAQPRRAQPEPARTRQQPTPQRPQRSAAHRQHDVLDLHDVGVAQQAQQLDFPQDARRVCAAAGAAAPAAGLQRPRAAPEGEGRLGHPATGDSSSGQGGPAMWHGGDMPFCMKACLGMEAGVQGMQEGCPLEGSRPPCKCMQGSRPPCSTCQAARTKGNHQQPEQQACPAKQRQRHGSRLGCSPGKLHMPEQHMHGKGERRDAHQKQAHAPDTWSNTFVIFLIATFSPAADMGRQHSLGGVLNALAAHARSPPAAHAGRGQPGTSAIAAAPMPPLPASTLGGTQRCRHACARAAPQSGRVHRERGRGGMGWDGMGWDGMGASTHP